MPNVDLKTMQQVAASLKGQTLAQWLEQQKQAQLAAQQAELQRQAQIRAQQAELAKQRALEAAKKQAGVAVGSPQDAAVANRASSILKGTPSPSTQSLLNFLSSLVGR